MPIILDIGNVICEWNPEKLLANIFDQPEEREIALKQVIQHSDWLELDKGTMSIETALTNAQQRCELNTNRIAQIYKNTASSLTPFPQMVELIKHLSSQNVELYVLSNMQANCWQHLYENYKFWDCFKGHVISSQIHLIKPDIAIFQHISQHFDLPLEKTLFFDDMMANVETARQFGINAIQITEPQRGADIVKQALSRYNYL